MSVALVLITLGLIGAPCLSFKASRLFHTDDVRENSAQVNLVQGGHCPEHWVAFGQSCYWFASNESRMMYFQATRHCKSLNGSLVTVLTEKEQKFLMSRLSDATTNLWIGIERLPNKTWTWMDGNPVTYTNWIIGQPRPERRKTEDCTEILTGTLHPGKWNQVRCNAKRMHVCEKKRALDVSSAFPGSFEYRQSCYRMGSYQDWDRAAEICLSQGGQLADVRDVFEDAFLSVKFNFRGGLFWIGLQDMKATGLFTWLSGWPVQYTNWAPLQPDASTGDRRCVAADLGNGDVACAALRHALAFPLPIRQWLKNPPEVKHHDGACPKHARNWIDVGNPYCYWLETERLMTFNESFAICDSKNSSLASFHSKEEVGRLSPYLRKSQHQLWIGLVSSYNDSYEWLDGSPLNYEHWKNGEPSSIDENCVEMRQFDALWNDIHCDVKNGFICAVEKEPQGDENEGATGSRYGSKTSAGVYVAVALGSLLVLVAAAFAIQQVVRFSQFRRRNEGLFSFENNVYIDPPVYDANASLR
ncbi:hypothetical protein MRX96_035076 [Rhipicephalus microplus]